MHPIRLLSGSVSVPETLRRTFSRLSIIFAGFLLEAEDAFWKTESAALTFD